MNCISEKLNVKRNTYDIIEGYLYYLRIIKKGYQSSFNDYRDKDVVKMEIDANDKSSRHPIHQILKPTSLSELLWDFEAVSLYPSVMWDGKSKYLE